MALPRHRSRCAPFRTPSATRSTAGSVSHQPEPPRSVCSCALRMARLFLWHCVPLVSAMSRRHAMIQIRFLRWGAPRSSAPNTFHSASYPLWANSRKTVPIPREVSAGTFSRQTHRGTARRTIRISSKNNPDFVPLIPAPCPAKLMSWHGYGKPPQIRSTCGTS